MSEKHVVNKERRMRNVEERNKGRDGELRQRRE